jgi:hypothetical protein
MMILMSKLVVGVSVLCVIGCASGPLPPEWQSTALGSVKGFTAAYLDGKTSVANFEYNRARADIASTGRLDLIARAELVRCAVRVASLEFDNCAGVQTLDADTAAPERAYAQYLRGDLRANRAGFDPAQAALLPEQHRAIAATKDEAGRTAALTTITDPLARLIAAGVLFQSGDMSPAGVAVAVNTASDQGWRRPLLAWLGVQLKLMDSDADAKARIQRRIDLVQSGAVKP